MLIASDFIKHYVQFARRLPKQLTDDIIDRAGKVLDYLFLNYIGIPEEITEFFPSNACPPIEGSPARDCDVCCAPLGDVAYYWPCHDGNLFHRACLSSLKKCSECGAGVPYDLLLSRPQAAPSS